MTSTTNLGSIEAIFLVLSVMINHIILNVLKDILDMSGSASILNVIVITALALILVYIICKLLKKFPGLDIIDISDLLGGKVLKYIIGILFVAYFLITTSIFLRSFCESLKLIYFSNVPISFLIFLFVVAIVLVNKLGTNSVFRVNLIVLPLVLFSIAFIFIANIGDFTFQNIYPIFGNGLATSLLSGMSNLFAFSGIICLYFIQPSLNTPTDFKKIAYTSIILSAVWLLLSVATLLFIFPSLVTNNEMLPMYFASRFIQFGRFFQRIDAMFLFIWIISMASYLSICMSFAVNIFKKISNFKYVYTILYIFGFLLFILSLIPSNITQIYFLKYEFYKYLVFILVFAISITILILANIKFNKKKGEVKLE